MPLTISLHFLHMPLTRLHGFYRKCTTEYKHICDSYHANNYKDTWLCIKRTTYKMTETCSYYDELERQTLYNDTEGNTIHGTNQMKTMKRNLCITTNTNKTTIHGIRGLSSIWITKGKVNASHNDIRIFPKHACTE